MANEALVKSRTRIEAQGNATALTATYDPNSGSYTGDTPAVLDNTYDGGSENCKGAEILNLELDVTTVPSADAVAQIWYSQSENGTNYSRWKYSHTVGEDILNAAVDLYDAGKFVLTAQYTKLAVMAVDYAFNADLLVTPKLMELQ